MAKFVYFIFKNVKQLFEKVVTNYKLCDRIQKCVENNSEVFVVNNAIHEVISAYQRNANKREIRENEKVEMPKEVLNKYGIIKLADEKKMTLDNIVEKPAIEDAPSNLTSYGRYLLTPEVFEHLDPKNTGLDGELWTVDAITKMAEEGDVIVEKTRGHWMTTGDPKNYMFALMQYTFDNEDFGDDIKEFVKNA